MAKKNRKYPPAFKVNGQLIRITPNQTKGAALAAAKMCEEKEWILSDPGNKERITARGDSLTAVLKAKGLI